MSQRDTAPSRAGPKAKAPREDGREHRGRIVGVGAQIAVAQVVRRKERRAAGQIEDQVAA